MSDSDRNCPDCDCPEQRCLAMEYGKKCCPDCKHPAIGAQRVIAETLAEHQDHRVSLEEDAMPSYLVRCQGNYEIAGCSWEKFAYTYGAAVAEWRIHVADEIETALGGLTREWGVVIDYPPRPEDDYPGAVVILDTYKLREAAEIVKRDKYPEDCYEVRPRWVSSWREVPQ